MIAVARLTVREAARRRVLWILVILAIVSVVLTAWGVDRLVTLSRERGAADVLIRLGVSQVLILIAFMFGFVLAMTAAFIGSPAIAGDLESGIALAVFARPIRRSSYLVGRWLGLAVVIVVYAALSGFLAIAAVGWVSGYTPPDPVLPVVYLAGEALVILTFAVALSTRLPPIGGGAVAVVAFGLTWLSGVVGGVGRALGTDVLGVVGDLARYLLPTDGLWRGVMHGLQPPLVVMAAAGQPMAEGNPFFAPDPPPSGYLAWCVAWVAIVLGLAALSLRGREP